MRALISRRDRRERNGAPAVEAQERLARLTHIAELCAIFDAPAARHAGVGKFHVDAAALELFKHGAFPRSPNGRLPEATDVENRIAAQGISERLGAGVVRHEARAFKSGRLRMMELLFRREAFAPDAKDRRLKSSQRGENECWS